MITAILNVWGRPRAFQEQLAAVRAQTASPSEIIVWHHADKRFPFDDSWFDGTTYIKSSKNFGVWARFAAALNARTDIVCVFDDDTIPGSRWFENCIATMEKHEGLLGSNGVFFKDPDRYMNFDLVGWQSKNERTTQVDIVGHSWFFKREWLAHYWSDLHPIDFTPVGGEDFHFSYVLQKQGIGTYVPPHPENDRSLWGSTKGDELGFSGPAIRNHKSGSRAVRKCLPYYVSKGFQLIKAPATL